MFKDYQAQFGDTPQKIARKELGDPRLASEIIKINNLPPFDELPIFPVGKTIKIPDDKPDDKSQIVEFKTDTGKLKSLSITIADTNLELFDNFQYFEPLAGLRGGGIVCGYDPVVNTFHRDAFKFGRSFKIIANNTKLLTGYTMSPAPVYSKAFKGITILYKSTVHTMVRSDIAPNNFPLEFSAGQTLKQIAERIAGLFNIKVAVESNVSNIVFDDGDQSGVSVGVMENAFDFLVRICQSRGVIVRDTADGGLCLFRAEQKPPIAAFIDGETEGLEGIAAVYNYEILSKEYNLFSQYGSNNILGTAENSLLPLNIFKNVNMPNVSEGLAADIAKWRMLREVSSAFKLTIPVDDWYTPEGVRYQPGEFVDIQSPQNGIFERRTFIIESVQLILNKGQYEAILTCTIPAVYTGDSIDYLPMI